MDLGALFHLEAHGPDTLLGVGPQYPWGGLYGGQIVAQALRAAASTVDDDMPPHSLRAYFIRRGDNTEPVRYEVDRIRNGRSFCTRRVVARQAIGAILNLEASFQRVEDAPDLTTVQMAAGLPSPDSLQPDSWTSSFERRWLPAGALSAAGGPGTARSGSGRIGAWMRVNDVVGAEDLLHRCWLAYLSDDLPTDSVRAALAERGIDDADKIFAASLDHAVWFHRPMRADQWHLYDVSCHGYVGHRGLATGHVFSADGVHVATIAQEVLLRPSR